MSFGQAVSTCLSKYVDFTGRARRSEFWWFVLFQVLVGIVALTVFGFAAAGSRALVTPSRSSGARVGRLLRPFGAMTRRS